MRDTQVDIMPMHQCHTTCISLSFRQKKKSFLYQIITEDESGMYYENQMKGKYWLDPLRAGPSQPKLNLPKLLLFV